MAGLCLARVLIARVPFERWRGTLGGTASGGCKVPSGPASLSIARHLSARVERAAKRLVFTSKCLPRAMALSWLLRRRRIAHEVVFAVRPPERRSEADGLHAWIEVDSVTILGDLPGPWVETLRLGDRV